MGAPLLKSRTILDTVLYKTDGYVTLSTSGEGRRYLVTLPTDVYDDMDHPKKVTLTLEPGDALNDPTHPSFAE